MNTDAKYIKNIVNANNDNSLAIFVGAGISKSSDSKTLKLPSWSDLINELKSELGENNENDFLKIAQLYHIAFGEHTYYKKIKQYFPDYIPPSPVHKIIFDIKPHVVITTNWDNILERAIEENAYIYDTVCSDADLVKSTLQNKLIKMHGDFKNHNIVFKEDDYINYQYNFPLLENYIRSILSTHTVLFLGYSYNDMDLKHILKWIQNRSEVRPPMYVTSSQDNPTQRRYLENHGITTIILNDDSIKIDSQNEFTNKTYTFLDKIKNHNKYYVANSNDAVDFVLGKLKILDDLDGILIEQVQKSLSNCGFVYDEDAKPILRFYKTVLTYDYDESVRSIYSKFVCHLQEVENKEKTPTTNLLRIFQILGKARIKGIMLTNDDSLNRAQYLPLAPYMATLQNQSAEDTNRYIDFDLCISQKSKSTSDISDLLSLSFNFYNLDQTEEAYRVIEEAIVMCLKQRCYTALFIAMFNRNVLLRNLQYSLSIKNREAYKDVEEYDLKERYSNLPKDLQSALEPIYQFVDFSFLYRYAHSIATDLKKIEQSVEIIQSGGFSYNSDAFKTPAKHENLLYFVLTNKIMIESFGEYEDIQADFIKIALKRQTPEPTTSLSRTEIFSCIKYIKNKELMKMLSYLYTKNSPQRGSFKLAENEDWLIDSVLENVSNQYLAGNNLISKFEQYTSNALLILSISNNRQTSNEKIFSVMNKLLAKRNNKFGILQSINLFIGIQYQLYKPSLDEGLILSLIETMVGKIIDRSINGHEYMALTRNDLSNLYGYAKERGAIFKNENLIKKLIAEIEQKSLSEQMDLCQSVLLSILEISSDEIKSLISSFIGNLDGSTETDDFKRISFKLMTAIHEFSTLDATTISEITTYIDKHRSEKSFSTAMFTLENQIKYLVENMGMKEMEGVLSDLRLFISKFGEMKMPSLI